MRPACTVTEPSSAASNAFAPINSRLPSLRAKSYLGSSSEPRTAPLAVTPKTRSKRKSRSISLALSPASVAANRVELVPSASNPCAVNPSSYAASSCNCAASPSTLEPLRLALTVPVNALGSKSALNCKRPATTCAFNCGSRAWVSGSSRNDPNSSAFLSETVPSKFRSPRVSRFSVGSLSAPAAVTVSVASLPQVR